MWGDLPRVFGLERRVVRALGWFRCQPSRVLNELPFARPVVVVSRGVHLISTYRQGNGLNGQFVLMLFLCTQACVRQKKCCPLFKLSLCSSSELGNSVFSRQSLAEQMSRKFKCPHSSHRHVSFNGVMRIAGNVNILNPSLKQRVLKSPHWNLSRNQGP